MKSWMGLGVALVAGGLISAAVAAELKSGPASGAPLAPFEVVKVAGAVDDGVSPGDELCYRCKYGSRPMVMVFSRTHDARVAKLAKELDATVAEHQTKKLAAFINFIGGDKSSLEKAARDLGAQEKIAHVALVVPVETENGPADYRLNTEADLTVLVCAGGKVQSNFAVDAESLTDSLIENIVASTEKALN